MRKQDFESVDREAAREAVTVSEITNNVRITVCPEYLEEHSEPNRASYAFSYTITIENIGDHTVQLLRRQGVVNSGGAEFLQVKGDGVVGEQPVLEANDGFRYSSGTVIKDPVGTMHGFYTFRSEDGTYFEVTIPRFDLIYPHLLH